MPDDISKPFDFAALWRYMGAPDALTEEKAGRIVTELEKACSYREIYREFAVAQRNDGIYLDDGIKLEGSDITLHLKDCHRCLLFAATLGAGADGLIRRYSVSDMASSVLCDSAASVLIESLCDRAEEKLRERYRAEGLFLTGRYSPGYGDLPLETNRIFADRLDMSRRLGVTVTEDMLMLPRKTVTAILGISEKDTKGHLAGCEGCKLYNDCERRKEGKRCADR